MERPNLLIIGAGGVGAVTAHKAVQHQDAFGRIILASRTETKLERIGKAVAAQHADSPLETATLNARDVTALTEFLRANDITIVINVASTYCNTAVMDACLAAGAHYIDTSVAEDEHAENVGAPWYANHEWPRRAAFAEKKLSALLSIGFDPGVVNVFCAYAAQHLFDTIETIDIIDVNGGDHGRFFATNFDPDVNLREIKEDVIFWENGAFQTVPHHTRRMSVDLPDVGQHEVYSVGHDELHSLPLHFPDAKRIEFWMGFGTRYLKVFHVLDQLGLLSSLPVAVGREQTLAPLQMVKAVLPDPASLAEGYQGAVCIGCDIRGVKDGQAVRKFIYSTCSHAHCYDDVGSQAISYTTGVPAMTAALLLARGDWSPGTMVNVEALDPDPFMELMPKLGIGWEIIDLPTQEAWPFIETPDLLARTFEGSA